MKTPTKYSLSSLALTASMLTFGFGRELDFNLFHYLAVLVAFSVSVLCVKTYAAELKEESRTEMEVLIQSGADSPDSIRARRQRVVLRNFGVATLLTIVVAPLLAITLRPGWARVLFIALSVSGIVLCGLVALWRVRKGMDESA